MPPVTGDQGAPPGGTGPAAAGVGMGSANLGCLPGCAAEDGGLCLASMRPVICCTRLRRHWPKQGPAGPGAPSSHLSHTRRKRCVTIFLPDIGSTPRFSLQNRWDDSAWRLRQIRRSLATLYLNSLTGNIRDLSSRHHTWYIPLAAGTQRAPYGDLAHPFTAVYCRSLVANQDGRLFKLLLVHQIVASNATGSGRRETEGYRHAFHWRAGWSGRQVTGYHRSLSMVFREFF